MIHIGAENANSKPEKQNNSDQQSTSNNFYRLKDKKQSMNYNAALGGEINFDDLLDLSIDNKASDIHLAENERIVIRINGKLTFIKNIPQLTKNQAEKLIFSMIKNPLHKERLLQTRELDFAYQHKDGTNFRINMFFKRNHLACVMRIIGRKTQSMKKLGIPQGVQNLIQKKQGLILVTGPTGSGKSTTMQSMLDYINTTRIEHIVTIEDPIEFVFESKKSIFSQREIGSDTLNFSNALRAVLREDPDVVMIGEMRDPETIMAAMNLSETGHLVISTLHTSGAPQTIHRLINAFPPEQHNQIQSRLSDTLIGVISQRLIPRIDTEDRIGIFELMLVNSAIKNVIRTGDFAQIYNTMLSGRSEGMVTMQDFAYNLVQQNIVKEKDFIQFFTE